MAAIDYVNAGLNILEQGANVYNSFRGESNSSNEGNVIHNENHYHITKSPEEIAIEKEKLELQRQRNSFDYATKRSQHAEDIRTQRKLTDKITDKKEDNTHLYMLGGIILIGMLFTIIKK